MVTLVFLKRCIPAVVERLWWRWRIKEVTNPPPERLLMRCCYQKDPKQLVISPRLKQNTCALLPAQTVADKYPPDRPAPHNKQQKSNNWVVCAATWGKSRFQRRCWKGKAHRNGAHHEGWGCYTWGVCGVFLFPMVMYRSSRPAKIVAVPRGVQKHSDYIYI